MAIRTWRSRRLFVTGGAGFLGRHIVNGHASQGWEVVAPGSRSADLRHRDAVLAMVRDWKPTAIIHTAYRRGDRAAIVDASGHVAEAAVAVGARLVHVSSDAVFGGRAEPYTEHDPASPVNDYGRDKADAEADVGRTDPGAVIVRTSLIYGSGELSVHEEAVRDAISGRMSTSFFTDEFRSPVLAGDLANALVDLATMPQVTGILHLGGPDALSRAELAVMIARRHGWNEARLRFSTIAEAGLTRPSRVVLDSGLAATHGLGVRGPADLD
jgi:dTDP-4-dehydrorhamnose reductase